jgi:hypothetical protein
MSDSNEHQREVVKNWLIKNYPTEAVFIDEINKTVNQIYQHAGIHATLKENEPKPLLFQIVKRHETRMQS